MTGHLTSFHALLAYLGEGGYRTQVGFHTEDNTFGIEARLDENRELFVEHTASLEIEAVLYDHRTKKATTVPAGTYGELLRAVQAEVAT